MKNYILLIFICLSIFFLGCGNENISNKFNENPFKEFSNEPVTTENYQNYFVYEYADEAYKFYDDYKKIINAFKPYEGEVAKEKLVFLEKDEAIFSDDFTWKIKQGLGKYAYIGQYSDGKPNGVGMVIYVYNGTYSLIYFGNFKDGKYDGYGREYFISKNPGSNFYKEYAPLGVGYEPKTTEDLYKYGNFLIYEGNFKDGKYNGKGNSFRYSNLKEITTSSGISSLDGDLSVFSGIFEDGKENGSFVVYKEENNKGYLLSKLIMEDGKGNGKVTSYFSNGNILYDGNMENDQRSGEGKAYNKDGQLIYDGEWYENQYNGNGKLYDNNGNLIYDGQWKNGMKMEG